MIEQGSDRRADVVKLPEKPRHPLGGLYGSASVIRVLQLGQKIARVPYLCFPNLVGAIKLGERELPDRMHHMDARPAVFNLHSAQQALVEQRRNPIEHSR